jgi:2-oxoglutarate dehydrogenase E2 component (dihydrolipoamide succinyltransferase)
MIVEIKVPSPGESITEVEVGAWLVENGSLVEKDQEIAEIESDKATLTVSAGDTGKIEFKAEEGDTLEVGDVLCTIDTDAGPAKEKDKEADEQKPEKEEKNDQKENDEKEDRQTDEDKKVKEKESGEKENKKAEEEKSGEKETQKEEKETDKSSPGYDKVKVTAVAKEMMKEHDISIDDIIKGLKRIGKKEVETAIKYSGEPSSEISQKKETSREADRTLMSSLRRKLSQRLVAVKNETAMLTTFNEVDMSAVMALRNKYQQQFVDKHGIKLGLMSFFTKAVALAMNFYPKVNAQIDGDEIVSPRYVDVGIAVSTPKGLMVPVVRNVESKSVPQIELEIKELAEKARNKKISVDELSGGTFTITNGGVFGSLLSTPILNPPQSGILGMHNIVERPMAINGQVVIRPMMYLALSYDHRIVDGKDSVGFLVKVKELIENPEQMLTGGEDAVKLLLEI